jgi:hypothetical protein
MQAHALRLLDAAEFWEWPITQRTQQSGEPGCKFKARTTRLLYYLITESDKLGGIVLTHFWLQLGSCDPKLSQNSKFESSMSYVHLQTDFLRS